MKVATHIRGITGLETAIIIVAFVVVASVFVLTLLATGGFSSTAQVKGEEVTRLVRLGDQYVFTLKHDDVVEESLKVYRQGKEIPSSDYGLDLCAGTLTFDAPQEEVSDLTADYSHYKDKVGESCK